MGNQQPKEKSTLSIGVHEKNLDTEIFNSNGDIGVSSDLWRQDAGLLSTKNETNNLSSFTVSDPKNKYITAQTEFIATRLHSHISVKKGEKLKFKDYSPDMNWVNVKRLGSKEEGWIPANIISDISEECENSESNLQQYSWYHGAVQRSFAEYLLNSGINGSFLVRESESNPKLRSISLRYDGKIWHFRISKDSNNKYYVVETQRFDSIQKLIEYHSKYADKLPCQLLYAAPKRAQATVFGIEENDSSDNWEINRTEILMKDQLGGGQYGIVYEGFWQRHNITVAVKTVKTDITVADDFLEEARLMKSLQHPNLVRLLGVCTREPPNYIITEFMENGNLLDYLRIRPKEELSPPVLLYMAIQISAGMEYLEAQNFIHRDLAARNCLVGQDNIVKVADFGLARCMERDDIYTAHVGSKFPIKWTAPEGLAYNSFSTKSDVWAFGILLWELATYGMTPYPGIELQDVYVYLQNDNIMARPPGCPENVYDLMKQCWQWKPENRPTFINLHLKLETMLSNINEQVDLEMAKENIVTKSANIVDEPLPSLTQQLQPLSQSITKKKDAPIPPTRTITLKDPSPTPTLNQPISNSIGHVIKYEELLLLPPPDEAIRKKSTDSNHNELSNRLSSNFPPPVMKNKPKRVETTEFPLLTEIEVAFSKNKHNLKPVVTENIATKTVNFVPKPAARFSKHISTEDDIKRSQSDLSENSRPPEKTFQSELKSRLKMQQKEEDDDSGKGIDERLKEENQFKSNAVWPNRKSMGQMTKLNSSKIGAASPDINVMQSVQPSQMLMPPNKRMSWTGPASSSVLPVKMRSNLVPLPSLSSSNLCAEDPETDLDDFIARDNLMSEFSALCQELVNLKSITSDQNMSEKITNMVERLETVHLGSTRYCNSSITSAKIKFKFIEQSTKLHSGIESLRKCLKPYDHSSVLMLADRVRTSLVDLRMLIETSTN